MNILHTYKSKSTGLFLIGILLSAHMTCNKAKTKAPVTSGKSERTTTVTENKTEPIDTSSVTPLVIDQKGFGKKNNASSLLGTIIPLPQTATPQTATDTPKENVSKALLEIRQRKGTASKHKDDNDMDVVNQKLVQTSDQHLDIEKVKEVPDTTVAVKEKKVIVSDKNPNTEAIPVAPTQLINTMDAAGGFNDAKAATPNDSSIVVHNNYNANLQGQMNTQLNSLFTTTLLKDSMMAEGNKDFLFNSITITNVSSAKLSLLVTIVIPNGWQTVTDKVITVNLDPNASTVLYMRLAPQTLTSAGWKQVRIEYRNTVTGDSRSDFYSVRLKEFSRFKAKLLNPNMVLPGYQKLISLPVYVKNSGNTNGVYDISYNNDFFHLDGKTSIALSGGSDTSFHISMMINENEWNMLKKEDIKIVVKNGTDAYNLVQTISRVGYLLKEHSSAYMDMPLQLEAGVTSQGQQAAQYYGALYGGVDIDSKDRVAFALRSNTISKDGNINNGLMRMDYTGAHVNASIGNIMEMTDFMMDGYGAKAGFNWGKDNVDKAVVYGQLQSRVGDSKVFGTNVQLGINDHVKLLSSVSADIDHVTKLNSSIARETIDMKFGKSVKLALITGMSVEQNTAKLDANTADHIVGGAAGYNFQFIDKHLNIVSSAMINGNSFAGVYKGQRTQSHDVRWQSGKIFVGGYYEYNYKEQTSYYDSVLLHDVFGAKSDNIGARIGGSNKLGNIILSAGQQKQLQSGEGNNFEMFFKYMNVNTTINLLKKINLNLNSYAGNGSAPSMNVNNIFISSNTGTLNVYNNSGIAFRYDKGPFYYSDFATYIQHPSSVERTMISPYIDLQLFKEKFAVRAQYNYSQTIPDNVVNANVMMNLSYTSTVKGYDLHLTGTLPVQGAVNNPYLNLSVRMRLNAPCIVLRKYYKVKILLFRDLNANGKKEDNEEPIAGQMVSINGNLFVSDDNGMLVYENVEKGKFKADFGYTSKVRGWIPTNGAIQSFEVKGNTLVSIPYSRSKVLSGKLNVQVDSTSNLKFDPSKIKVTAKSEDGNTYSTLTDDNGEFYFNLPSGHYIVSLSDVAFDEHFRPTQASQPADMENNETKTLYYEIRQRRRQINISK